MTQAATKRTVITLVSHNIPGLFRAFPISIRAMVNPTFGKTKLHHERWKRMSLMPQRTETREILKNQSARVQSKIAELSAPTRRMSGIIDGFCTRDMLEYEGKTRYASEEIPRSARPVNEGGPTAMNIPGLVFDDGKPAVMSLPM